MTCFGSAGIRRVRSAFLPLLAAIFVAAAIPGHADEPNDGPATGEVSRPSGKGPARTAGPIERPHYFEPTPQGWPGQTLDERDIAPYLAFHQARIAERISLMATTPTTNQGKWDARFYDIDVDLNPSLSRVTGTVIIRATVTNGPLTTLDLDFAANLTLTEVRSANIVVGSSRSADVLTVNLDRSYVNGETITVQVKYFGTPAGGYFNFNTNGGQPMVWSLSEPFGARTWWPCKDYSSDKADSVDIQVRVPSNLITASNGTRILNTSGGGFATTKWKERYPIATYLVFVASHPYTVANDWYVTAMGDSVPLTFWMFPGSVGTATPVNALVNDMMTAFAPLFGEYPFENEKYGHAQFLFGGGMEHQTCTCLGVYTESVTAHELAHQWWGDKVTCRTFNHIWLNEGFASYGEALWAEANGGVAARNAEMDLAKYFGAGTVYVPDLSDENRIFDSNLSYNKGSWVLHMLRGVVGEDDFFDGLQAYNTQYAYNSATTENLRDAFELQSGLDLDRFFQQWVYGEYYPEYDYDWSVVPAGGGFDVYLTIDQTQSWQLFKMPITMRVSTTGGPVDFTVNDSLATQAFVLHTAAQPTDVALDPDEWILKSVVVPLGTPTFDRSILVVNGVDWLTYGAEITNAYAAEAFWGDYNIDFWDYFPTPGGGYPGTLPAPLGHGAVPANVMRHYRNVIWVGNNFNGDQNGWYDSPILSYLEAGGNVMLLSRQGEVFLTPALQDYLGITWSATGTTITDCIAFHPGLTSIARTGTQNLVSVFNQTLTRADADLLYRAEAGFTPDVGIGVLRRPTSGGTYRTNGGRFIFLSGRPYRWNSTNLKNNIMYLLLNKFFEPLDQSAVPDSPGVPVSARLLSVRPNPTSSASRVSFELPKAGTVRLSIVDVSGRLVRRLVDSEMAAGAHEATWDGVDASGSAVASGMYYAILEADGAMTSRTLVRVR